VKMGPLAKPALEAAKKGEINFYPKRWTKVYTNWMENIRDWCISRQIWWGHRIPVYYCKGCQSSDGESGVIVSRVKPDKCPECGSVDIIQDEDVLDTWFSSWLWPFSTLGWPKETKDVEFFYPTDTLVTAQEIIFFWVARMIMAGMEFMEKIPFKDVYIHGTVRDDTGTKMSKSLGNIIDPIDIIERFGTDALRFSIISITSQGQDVFLSPQKFEIGRNFANKLWNASRFVLMNLKGDSFKQDLCQMAGDPSLTLADRWILSRFYCALSDFSKALDSYRINDAANRIYEFIWHEFCDWYLEIAKLSFEESHTQITLYKVLEKSLRVLHPIMPFITEEIWQRLPREHNAESIMVSPWPHVQKAFMSKEIDEQMELVIHIIQTVRNIRANWRITPSSQVKVFIKINRESDEVMLKSAVMYIQRLARAESVTISKELEKPHHAAVQVIRDIELFVPLEGVIDVEKEKQRLQKRLQELETFLGNIEKKFKNKTFMAKAPKDVIEKEKGRKGVLTTEIEGLKKNLSTL